MQEAIPLYVIFATIGCEKSDIAGMDQSDANDLVFELLSKGVTSRQLLVLAAHHRRIELEKQLLKTFNNQIADGPFKGAKQAGFAHGSTLCPKILGSYENELSNRIKNLTRNKSCFIDIGCAEGYYTTGIGLKYDVPVIIGVDISNPAIEQAKKSAEINNISKKCIFETSIENASNHLSTNCLAMIDVDGDEVKVINSFCHELSRHSIQNIDLIIETDYQKNGKSNSDEIARLLKSNNFEIKEIIYQDFSMRKSEASKTLTNSLLDLIIYGLEGRPLDQHWIIAHR